MAVFLHGQDLADFAILDLRGEGASMADRGQIEVVVGLSFCSHTCGKTCKVTYTVVIIGDLLHGHF